MKKNDKAKLHQSTIDQLQDQVAKLQIEVVKTNQEIKIGKQTNLKAAKNLRHQIAIIKTLITQKQLQEEK